jgi:hypothetical protein
MATPLAAAARESLTAHVAAKGAEICAKYGPTIGWGELRRLLDDRAFVRYPCELRFDASPLRPGEFAYPEPKGEAPEDGFRMNVHPIYMADLAAVPALVLYHLVAVNYGEFVSADDAETFAAAALGLPREAYYRMICELADRLSLDAGAHPEGACSCG